MPPTSPRPRRSPADRARVAGRPADPVAEAETTELARTAGPPRNGRRIAWLVGRTAVILVALIVLGSTGYAWARLQAAQNGLVTDDVIDSAGGGEKPADGSIDILLVGMDSRTDVQGNALPPDVLASLHAGDDQGEIDTDTMILVHIPNNGGPAIGVSIPRDSWVNIPGFGTGKINSAYGQAKTADEKTLKAQGDTDQADIERKSNEAGAKEAVRTVQALTGVTIDHYAEVNLYGFDQLSNAVGGVPVCLKQAVDDTKWSGAKFPAGQFEVQGVQALEFVRQRHNIPGGSTDLEREQRQQAFLASMAHKILSAGTLTSPGTLDRLISAVQQSIVIDSGWNLTDFARQMSNMSSGDLKFETIPIKNQDYWPSGRENVGAEAVEVDPNQVRAFVHGGQAPSSTPSSPSSGAPSGNAAITVDVKNGSPASGLASNVLDALAAKGFGRGTTGNTSSRSTSIIYFPSGGQADAQQVNNALGGGLTVAESPSVPSGHVWVYLGRHYTGPGGEGVTGDRQLDLDAPAGQSPPTSGSPSPGSDSGAAGSPVISDPNGTAPCVN